MSALGSFADLRARLRDFRFAPDFVAKVFEWAEVPKVPSMSWAAGWQHGAQFECYAEASP
jgi:hypothetical protein